MKGRKNPKFRTFAAGVGLFLSTFNVAEEVRAGENADAPEISTPITVGSPQVPQPRAHHGFGGFGAASEFTSSHHQDDEFLNRIRAAEDVSCKDTYRSELRNFVYLELRDRVAAKMAAGESAGEDDVRKFLGFLVQASARSRGDTFFSTRTAGLGRAPASEAPRLQAGLLGIDSQLALKQLSLVKIRQLEAQEDPDKSIHSCRNQDFLSHDPAIGSASDLKQQFRTMSKCRIEEDSSCLEKWATLCPAYQVEIFDGMAKSDFVPEAQKVLAEKLSKDRPCAKALLEVVYDKILTSVRGTLSGIPKL